jgi:hypothetical protein
LVLAGYPGRGGAVVAGFGPLAVGLLIVLLGRHLWRAQPGGGGVLSGATLEWILLASTAVVGLGVVLWLVQILDGVRLASPRLRTRASHSDLLAVILLIALASAPWLLRPSHLAASAEGWADTLEGEGMQVVPLFLVRGAAWIDPGDPLHTLHAARLHEALGQDRKARALREDLRQRWERVAHAVRSPRESARGPDREEGPFLLPEPARLQDPPR